MSIPDLAPGAPSRILRIDAVQLGEGAPKSGHVAFTLLSDLRVLSSGMIIAAGTVTVPLRDGKGEIRVPTKSPSVTDDCGDDWVILVKKSWHGKPYAVQIPTGTSALNLGDLAPARPLTRREQQWAVTAASVSVDTLAPGSDAGGTVTLNGGALDFRLRIPKGEQGLPGPGATAADTAVAAYVGSSSQTQTALETRFRGRTYSPRQFGITGDGTTSESTPWRNMLAALPPGAVVECPPGDTYRCGSRIDVVKPVTIMGGHFLPADTYSCMSIRSSDVTLRDVAFTAASATPETTHKIIDATGTSQAPLRNIIVDGCTINGTRYQGIWAEWCEDVKVTNSAVTDFQYAAIMLISVTRAEVSGNVIRNGLQGEGIVNTYGIAATDLQNSIAARSRDVLITRNIVDNIPRWEGIDTHGGERITITDNVITRCYDGIAAVVGNDSRATAPRHVVISGNTIDSMSIASPRSAIRLYGKTGGEQATGVIGGNVIRGAYLLDVEAKNYEEAGTVIQAQATTVPSAYSSHPAPLRQWGATTNIIRNGDNATRVVSLPAGVFTKAPLVFLTPQPGATAPAVGWTWRVSSASATEITIVGNGPVGQIDIQMGILCVQMGSLTGTGIPRN